jgi:hypothetical protein
VCTESGYSAASLKAMIEKPHELKFKDSYVDLLDEVVFALLKEKKA